VPLFVGRIGTTLYGIPHGKGAFAQMATVKANGYTHIPAPVEGYEAGTELEAFLTTDTGSIERTLFLTGTLDPALEELVGLAHDKGLFVYATNPGNTAGFLALGSNTCHAAPLVLPAQSLPDSYLSLVKRIKAEDLVFIHVATIEMGIASRDGLGVADLTNARFINTRRESPARMVLDTLLAAEGIDPSRVSGYLQEVHGPPAVAAAVRNGFADAGMCTSGIASANGLRFVPVAHEDYELAVRREMLADSRMGMLIDLIRSPAYQNLLVESGGYSIARTGTIRCLSPDLTLAECTLPVNQPKLPQA
jgi:putative molybdopterin biosynthesis protein